MTWGLLAALGSACAWASLDVLRKQLAGRLTLVSLTIWLNLGFLPGFVAWAVGRGAGLPDAGYVLPWLVEVGVAVSAQVLFLHALRAGALSVVVPMLALTPALSAVLAWAALGEVPSGARALGLALVVGGCLVQGMAESRGPGLAEGTAAMAGVAALWSLGTVLDKACLGHADPAFHATAMASGCAALLTATLVVRGRTAELRIPRDARPRLAVGILALGVAYSLQLVALGTVLVGVVEGVKRGVGLSASVLTGWAFFGERPTPGRAARVVILVAGVALLVR